MQVIQDSIDGLLLLNAGNDLHSTSAMPAGLNVNIEDSLQSLRPGHRHVTLGGRFDLDVVIIRLPLSTSGRSNQSSPSMVGS
jgi:hypothetical protein